MNFLSEEAGTMIFNHCYLWPSLSTIMKKKEASNQKEYFTGKFTIFFLTNNKTFSFRGYNYN